MKLQALLLLTITPTYLCLNVTNLFEAINQNVLYFNKKAAELLWESSVDPGNPKLPEKAARYQKERIKWRDHDCRVLATLYKGHLMNTNQTRQACLMHLCRKPKYDDNESRILSGLYNDLQEIYTEAEICIPSSEHIDNIPQVETAILKYLTKPTNFKSGHDVGSKIAKENKEKGFCIKGEKDFEKVMEISRNEAVLQWVWMVWREKVGVPMKEPYRRLVEVENVAVRRHGYKDLGKSWRDELETPYLRQLCHKLYNDIKPLYTVLHGVVRFYLRRFYGEVVPERGPIPAHLLGNLWSKNWEPLLETDLIDLNQSIKKLNWTALDMARKADDFYRSLGLPAMTDTFWRESVIRNDTRCPAAITVANMYKDGDYRLIYCSGTTIEDFRVFHHVMGHVQYYMAYENQPALFRDANPALHESIGDAIMYGVMTPQHLHRLGLVNNTLLYICDGVNANNDGTKEENVKPDAERSDEKLKSNAENNRDKNGEKKRNEISKEGYLTYIYSPGPSVKNKTKTNRDSGQGFNKGANENQTKVLNKKLLNYTNVENGNSNNPEKEKDVSDESFTTDEILLLKQLLNKLPQIPFLLLIDEYRWKYFEGSINMGEENREFWKMVTEIQGIAPPNDRGEEFFDVGAEFHVPYNKPSIRYFLSSFLQHQLFENLCKAAVFGRRRAYDKLPDSIPLHRCDIYGSKAAGKVLKDLMSRGHSQHWREILEQVTGDSDISAVSLWQYYLPIYERLWKLVEKYDIPIGWREETNYFA